MYVNLPEEKDTYGIESLLKPKIEQRVGLTVGANPTATPP